MPEYDASKISEFRISKLAKTPANGMNTIGKYALEALRHFIVVQIGNNHLK